MLQEPEKKEEREVLIMGTQTYTTTTSLNKCIIIRHLDKKTEYSYLIEIKTEVDMNINNVLSETQQRAARYYAKDKQFFE